MVVCGVVMVVCLCLWPVSLITGCGCYGHHHPYGRVNITNISTHNHLSPIHTLLVYSQDAVCVCVCDLFLFLLLVVCLCLVYSQDTVCVCVCDLFLFLLLVVCLCV